MRKSNRWNYPRTLIRVLFLGIIVSPLFGFTFFLGTFSSGLFLGKIHLTDPLAGLQIALAQPGSLMSGFIVSILLVVCVYALLGRVYCSWVCPLGLLLEIADQWLVKIPIRIKATGDISKSMKYTVLSVTLSLALLSSMPVFEIFSPMSIFMRMWLYGIGIEILLIIAVIVLNWLFGANSWCNRICPLGALYSLLGKVRVLSLNIDTNHCTQCGACYQVICKVGPEVLRPAIMSGNAYLISSDCTNCGDCIGNCPSTALTFTIRLPRKTSITNIYDAPSKQA
ncbi:hypothetical protein BHU72_03620 [Desulfuribacillus stibiiarsenatis]|uniref:4Fe-4S ferredoxin-type domain-containing protein n=1 Tax=Desulfuribacillus stibiiarsenatis TaxID=1390249 RepID=A0A1E5L6U5_9FIRM|nr:4Fe-4S binding protein [Desulfuribacillus stibiiarsenatis]OEH85877.1 hypothetical protein BHU72_03620 [Desulfuribacillus stibiiarsenatis]